MSNIRTLRDLQHQPESRPFPALPQQSAGQSNSNLVAVNAPNVTTTSPSLKDVLAPDFTSKSFIFTISMFQIGIFVIEFVLSFFLKDNPSKSEFPPSVKVLKYMGAKYLPCIQRGEVFRFVTCSFLHAGILHILSNLLSQSSIGYTAEKRWGTRNTIIIYFATACGGSLLSCIGQPYSVSVGASGALLGVIGAYMSWLLMNWNNREILSRPSAAMCNIMMWFLLIFLLGSTSNGIDNYAHFGGWVTGIFMAFALLESSQPISWISKPLKILRTAAVVCVAGLFALGMYYTFFVLTASGKCWD